MTRADERIDLSGVPCPANVARLLLRLEAMDQGTPLEVIVDDGEPAKNVRDALLQDGHTILKDVKNGASWNIRVRKE